MGIEMAEDIPANKIKESVRNNILGFSIRRFIKLIVYLETYLQ